VRCRFCQSPNAEKRADTVYCGRECRDGHRLKRLREENRERKAYEASTPVRYASWILECKLEVLKHAPEMAIGYRTGLWTGAMTLWLPQTAAARVWECQRAPSRDAEAAAVIWLRLPDSRSTFERMLHQVGSAKEAGHRASASPSPADSQGVLRHQSLAIPGEYPNR